MDRGGVNVSQKENYEGVLLLQSTSRRYEASTETDDKLLGKSSTKTSLEKETCKKVEDIARLSSGHESGEGALSQRILWKMSERRSVKKSGKRKETIGKKEGEQFFLGGKPPSSEGGKELYGGGSLTTAAN